MHRRLPTPLAITILLSVAAVLAGYLYFGDTSLKQTRRMRLGYKFLPTITNAVGVRPEFHDVRIGISTAKAGCFLVLGQVESHAQLSRLKDVIAATQPPLDVIFNLKVLEDYAETPNAEPASGGNR